MSDVLTTIGQYEKEAEAALVSLEMAGALDAALAVYRDVEARLEALGLEPAHPAYAEKQGLLAYCLMRQGNILRQKGQMEAAMEISEREIAAARASKDDITLGRSLMSYGFGCMLRGEVDRGLGFAEEARARFASGESYDHRQGLGWYWILRADLGNKGIFPGGPREVIKAADEALAVLLPIENWPGVGRAYAARAEAYEVLGDGAAAAADREAQAQYERLGLGSVSEEQA